MRITTALPVAAALCAVAITVVATGKPDRRTSSTTSMRVSSLASKANSVLGLEKSALVRPSLPEHRNRPFRVALPFDGELHTLDLLPFSVRSPKFEVLIEAADGSLVELPRSEASTYRGEIEGVPGSFVTASVQRDGLNARVITPDGGEFWIEPIGRRITGAHADDHVVYRTEDVLEGGGTCAAMEIVQAEAALIPETDSSTASSATEQLRVAELACDADYEYFQRWGSISAVSDRIESVINTVNVQYEQDVAITHVITSIIVRTSAADPYTSTDPNTLLNEMRNHWENNHKNVKRDVAHLFTGKNLDGSVIGVAWLNAVCSSFGYGLSQSDFTSSFACVTDLTAHELGHNWGAGHCSCSTYTMNSGITCANQFHPTETIPEIITYRDSVPCLDLASPVPPADPTDLTATAVSDSAIDLAWSDNSATELGFDIDRSPDGGATWSMIASVGADSTTYRDSNLPAATTFHYRLSAYNSAGESNFTNIAEATTDPLPLPPEAPAGLTAQAQSESQIDLAWTDNSAGEDGFTVERLEGAVWVAVGATGADTTAFSDSGLNPSTEYSYRVNAFNNGGTSGYSNIASGTTHDPPPFVDQLARSETPVAGSVSGSYQDTHADDGSAQSIEERETSGKPTNRYSYLEHVWEFDVVPGTAIALLANAWSSGSSDGDTFRFEYSTNGTEFTLAFVVSSSSSDNQSSAVLPASISGTLWVRVVDTDRTPGNRAQDTVFVDELIVRSDLLAGDPPLPPSALQASTITEGIQLDWADGSSDEYGFEIERSDDGTTFAQIDSVAADVEVYVDTTVLPSRTYYYRVRAFNGAGLSPYSNTSSATTPDGIVLLSAEGYKIKGVQHADLTWEITSAAQIDIYRDGVLIATTANDGTYTDRIGAKGNGSYEYHVCEQGGSCSNSLTVSF